MTGRTLGFAGLLVSLSLAGTATAGGPDTSTFTVVPSSGPSPNTVIVSGEDCFIEEQVVTGGIANGPVATPGAGVVELWNRADSQVIHIDGYPAEEDGSWSGEFDIPAGLKPGTYPVKARCSPILRQESAVEGSGFAVLGQPAPGGFSYDRRSYTVPGRSRKAKAVEADVTFTG